MKQFPHSSRTVYEEFVKEGFGIKTTNQAFLRIAKDQATGHVNKMCKIAKGIVNITRNESARQRWELNYNERAHLTQLVYEMFVIPTTTLFAQRTKTKSHVRVIFRI